MFKILHPPIKPLVLYLAISCIILSFTSFKPKTEPDVYVVGSEDRSAVYWKNGIKTILATGPVDATATNIYVAGKDVYITGYTRDTTGYGTAKWKGCYSY
ncbi:hypothetical protein [Xanthocytophaga agilis]|uniref:Uncharacterized protein n=1 Tax=Xanthocytophaga agilis TaxID=3048010 RepID=A0AAE3R444_9BACT|nr:hypothetical protein [Xanthocytophaga agilis]MDJ1500513.1 hypothetical protein [Xanthocytophaga agilis]